MPQTSIALRPLSLSMSNFGVIHLDSSFCTRRMKTNTLLEQVQLFVATTTKADGEVIATLNTQNAPERNSSIARDMMHHTRLGRCKESCILEVHAGMYNAAPRLNTATV